VAEKERLTKRERRELAREERRREEREKAARARRNRALTTVGVLAGIVGVAALFWFTREPEAETGLTVVRAAAEEASQDAGCETVEMPPAASTAHLSEPAPDAEDLYPMRPAHSGPHFPAVHPIGVFDDPRDERLVIHNLEHGAIIVWYDPDVADPAEVAEAEAWAEERNRAGFAGRSGAGIVVAPFERELDSGKAFAKRAWVVATDCDSFEVAAADAFLIENYGAVGQAPERFFAPYPSDVLQFEGEDDPGDAPVDDPQGEQHVPEGAGDGTEAEDGDTDAPAPDDGDSPPEEGEE
jgi:hypothetical protein